MLDWIKLKLFSIIYGFRHFCAKIETEFKVRKYHRLVKKYGTWQDIPEDEMPKFFAPTPPNENSQMVIVMTFNELAKVLNRELLEMTSGEILRRWMRNEFESLEEISRVNKFITTQTLNRDVINYFIECGDLKPHKLEYLLNSSEGFRLFYEGQTHEINPQEVKESKDV